MLVIDIVNYGDTVGFWNARDARKQGGPSEREDHLIKRSLPSNPQSSPGNSPASVD